MGNELRNLQKNIGKELQEFQDDGWLINNIQQDVDFVEIIMKKPMKEFIG